MRLIRARMHRRRRRRKGSGWRRRSAWNLRLHHVMKSGKRWTLLNAKEPIMSRHQTGYVHRNTPSTDHRMILVYMRAAVQYRVTQKTRRSFPGYLNTIENIYPMRRTRFAQAVTFEYCSIANKTGGGDALIRNTALIEFWRRQRLIKRRCIH